MKTVFLECNMGAAGDMLSAAVLKHFADAFGTLPAMKMEKVGYGMGTRDFGGVNCVRAILGQAKE